MRICFLPAGGRDTASSRIRVYAMQKALADAGMEAWIGDVSDPRQADVVVVQKRADAAIIARAEAAKRSGALIIYDVDDLSSALDYWVRPEDFRRMLELADLVTTDTAGHQDFLAERLGAPRVSIVPDCVDYGLEAPLPPRVLPPSPLRVMWFGSSSNLHMFTRYAGALCAVPGTQVLVCTTPAGARELTAALPAIQVVEWSLPGFPELLRSCHLSCLAHDHNDVDRGKSNNKMIASIALGVPALVSFTPEYTRTARAAGVGESLFTDPSGLPTLCERFRSVEARNDYLATAQPYVWEHFSPQAVAVRFLEVLEERLREDGRAPAAPAPSRPVPSAEVLAVLRDERPARVLQIGCHDHALLAALSAEFAVHACDPDPGLVRAAPPGTNATTWDPSLENMPFLRANMQGWDAIVLHGYMGKVLADPVATAYVINNLLMLAKGKILVWDTEDHIDGMRRFSASAKIEYRLLKE
jgi:hypothetical protein